MLTVTIEFTYHFFDTDFIVVDFIKFAIAMYQMNKGAKLTRSTSAYALPLFLPRPKNSRHKAPVEV